jgi:hypothetical protein
MPPVIADRLHSNNTTLMINAFDMGLYYGRQSLRRQGQEQGSGDARCHKKAYLRSSDHCSTFPV